MRSTLFRLLAISVLGGSALVVSSGALAERGSVQVGRVTPGVSFASTDQIIVKMRSDRAADAGALGDAAGLSVTALRRLDASTTVLKLPAAQSDAALRTTANAMANVPGVEWVEPDVRMFVSEDLSSQQWDLGPATAPEYGIDLAGVSVPAGQIVAVVDTGYLPHTDLGGQFVTDAAGNVAGYDFISDSRIGNDGDGRDADASDAGDWITSRESRRGFFRGCFVDDSSWHGTHVSGTIAARQDAEGIDGINPNARILPVRALGKCGGYTSDISDGVRWAAGVPVSGAPANPNIAKVVNLSLGGGGACSATWQDAIDAVTAVGTTLVVSAGNSDADASGFSPASCDGVITVAATGKAGDRSFYSNFGSSVEIAAPGGDSRADAQTILSTLNSGTTTPVASPAGDVYVEYQGTSMAAPHVSGVASLVLATQPGLAPNEVASVLQQSATQFPSGSSCAGVCGAGIVNASAAVSLAAATTPTTTTTPPTTSAPSTTVSLDAPGAFVKSGPSDGTGKLKKTVTLSWAPSSRADAYEVCIEVGVTPDGVCDAFTSGPYTGTSVKFVGLPSGTTYEWQVRAVNANGATVATGDAWSFSTR